MLLMPPSLVEWLPDDHLLVAAVHVPINLIGYAIGVCGSR
jgi:hypothetical protein